MSEQQHSPTPFFVRFLECQELPVDTEVKAGAWPPFEVTMKWPSDGDDHVSS